MKKLVIFNICIVIIFIFYALIIVFFFSTEEGSIYNDISERYHSPVKILAAENIEDSRIVLFSFGESKTGIANYIKLPLVNKYFRQEIYVLKNLEDQTINDVFKGKWNGYVITAAPEHIDLENTAKHYGIYWLPVYVLILLICIDWFAYMFIKARLGRLSKKF